MCCSTASDHDGIWPASVLQARPALWPLQATPVSMPCPLPHQKDVSGRWIARHAGVTKPGPQGWFVRTAVLPGGHNSHAALAPGACMTGGPGRARRARQTGHPRASPLYGGLHHLPKVVGTTYSTARPALTPSGPFFKHALCNPPQRLVIPGPVPPSLLWKLRAGKSLRGSDGAWGVTEVLTPLVNDRQATAHETSPRRWWYPPALLFHAALPAPPPPCPPERSCNIHYTSRQRVARGRRACPS